MESWAKIRWISLICSEGATVGWVGIRLGLSTGHCDHRVRVGTSLDV